MPAAICRSGLGQFRYLASLPAANDALVYVLLKQAGLQPFGDVLDHPDLAAVLATSTDEVTAAGYARVVRNAPATATFDTGNNRVDLDVADVVFPAVGTAGSPTNAGGLLVCYDPDTTSGTDATLLPLSFHDFRDDPEVLNGEDVRLIVPPAGLMRGASG